MGYSGGKYFKDFGGYCFLEINYVSKCTRKLDSVPIKKIAIIITSGSFNAKFISSENSESKVKI